MLRFFRNMAEEAEAVVLLENLRRLLGCTDRRREPRFIADAAATVHTLYPASFETLRGQIINVSQSGLAVRLSGALFRGTEIEIVCGKLVIIGHVKYSSLIVGGFYHGVEIDQMIVRDSVDAAAGLLSLAAAVSPAEELADVQPQQNKVLSTKGSGWRQRR